MRAPLNIVFTTLPLTFGLTLLGAGAAVAIDYCVKCSEPDQTYLCRVETDSGLQNDKGLQLFCIIRTSREGAHRSCKVDQSSAANCPGELKTYSFNAPAIPDKVRDALARRQQNNSAQVENPDIPKQKGGEPETLIEMTRDAVGASKEKIKNSGNAVGGAASSTTHKVGQAARGVGKGVATAAGKVGSVTKKTGGAVGGAAKSAWDCVTSLFKGCGDNQ